MDFMNELKVWRFEKKLVACADGSIPIPTRWIDHNKGDEENYELRSRLVLQETKRVTSIAPGDTAATFSATPPLEAL